MQDFVVAGRLRFFGLLYSREVTEVPAHETRRPVGFKTRISLGQQHQPKAVLRFGVSKGFLHPRDARLRPFGVLGVHVGRQSFVVIAADDVQRGEGHAVEGPHQIFAVFLEIRILRLAVDGDGFLAQTASLREEHLAHLGQAFHRIELARLDKVAIGPVVVPRRQDEGVHRFLERSQDPLEVLVGAGHGDLVRVPFVGPWIGLEIANVDHEGEALLVQRSHQAVELLLRDRGIGRVPDDTELEFLVLRIGNADESQRNNGHDQRSPKNRMVPVSARFLDHSNHLLSRIVSRLIS